MSIKKKHKARNSCLWSGSEKLKLMKKKRTIYFTNTYRYRLKRALRKELENY